MEKRIDVNKKIAKASTSYLKGKLIERQNSLTEKRKESIAGTFIDYKEFMNEFKKRRCNINSIDDYESVERIKLVEEQAEFVAKYEYGIIFSKQEINELIQLLNKVITNCGLGKVVFFTNENGFIREVFGQIVIKMDYQKKNELFEKEELKKISDWFSFFSSSEEIGFDKDSDSRFYYDHFDGFVINANKNESKNVFQITI